MAEKKKKNHQLYQRLSPTQFIAVSVIAHMMTFIVSQVVVNGVVSAFSIESINLFVTLITALPQLIIFAMQAYLLKYQFDWSASRWFKMSFIGWMGLVATIPLAIITTNFLNFSIFPLLMIGLSTVLTFVISMMQAIALSRYVSRAWFWIGAMYLSLVIQTPLQSAMLSFMPNRLPFWFRGDILNNGVSGAVLGIFFASTLILLVNLTQRDRQKLAHENDNLRQANEHLQDTDISNDDIADYTDHQPMTQSDQTR